MSQILRPSGQWLLLVFAALALLIVVAACRKKAPSNGPGGEATPQAKEPAGPSPSTILAARPRHNPPALTGTGDEAHRAVVAFIDWAGASVVEEHEEARKVMEGARDNHDIIKALTEEITKAQQRDHGRALLALAILGEMRSPLGEEFLRQFVNQPFPEDGTHTEEGEIVEQTALATLQAKAIDGLAYMHTASADGELFRQVKQHPSIIVRAEGVSAFLWNQRDKEAARRILLRYVRKGEERYLDQITREQGEKAESFNPKLEAYLKVHPEVVPPVPQYEKERRSEQTRQDQGPKPSAPPKF
jgi:hypothetical protein